MKLKKGRIRGKMMEKRTVPLNVRENTKTLWTVIISGICSVILGLIFGYGWGIEAGLPKLFAAILGRIGMVAFFVTCGLILIIYGMFQLQKSEQPKNFLMKYLFRYYSIRILAGLLFMGSFGIGVLAGAGSVKSFL